VVCIHSWSHAAHVIDHITSSSLIADSLTAPAAHRGAPVAPRARLGD
jgi:hypothetical protein